MFDLTKYFYNISYNQVAPGSVPIAIGMVGPPKKIKLQLMA